MIHIFAASFSQAFILFSLIDSILPFSWLAMSPLIFFPSFLFILFIFWCLHFLILEYEHFIHWDHNPK